MRRLGNAANFAASILSTILYTLISSGIFTCNFYLKWKFQRFLNKIFTPIYMRFKQTLAITIYVQLVS